MKIAFATYDGYSVNAHFGHAVRFDVYDVSYSQWTLMGSRILDVDDPQQRVEQRVALVDDCKIIFVNDLGGSAAARLTNARIQPIKVAFESSIITLIEQLQQTFNHSPAPWLRRILTQEVLHE